MSHLLTPYPLHPSLPPQVTNLSVDFMCTPGICKFKMLRMPNVCVCLCVCGQQVVVDRGKGDLASTLTCLRAELGYQLSGNGNLLLSITCLPAPNNLTSWRPSTTLIAIAKRGQKSRGRREGGESGANQLFICQIRITRSHMPNAQSTTIDNNNKTFRQKKLNTHERPLSQQTNS